MTLPSGIPITSKCKRTVTGGGCRTRSHAVKGILEPGESVLLCTCVYGGGGKKVNTMTMRQAKKLGRSTKRGPTYKLPKRYPPISKLECGHSRLSNIPLCSRRIAIRCLPLGRSEMF